MVLNLSDLDKSIVLQVPAEDTKLIDLLGEGNKNSELGQMFRVPRGLSHGIAGIEPGAIFVAIATIILLRSAAIFALSYLSSRRFKVYVQSTGSSLPNALPKPFLSNLRHKLILVNNKGGDLLDVVFADKYRKYGPTHALYDEFGVPKVIHTIDPANLTAVLVTREKDWASPKNRTNTLYPLAQEGLLTTSGERWHRNRKMIHRQIGSKRAKDVRSSEGDIQLLFQAIGPADKDSWTETVDLYELYHRCALDMSTKYLMGESSQSQAAGIKNKAKEQAKLECGLVEPRSFWKELSYDEAFETVRGYLALRSKLGSKYWLADGFQVPMVAIRQSGGCLADSRHSTGALAVGSTPSPTTSSRKQFKGAHTYLTMTLKLQMAHLPWWTTSFASFATQSVFATWSWICSSLDRI